MPGPEMLLEALSLHLRLALKVVLCFEPDGLLVPLPPRLGSVKASLQDQRPSSLHVNSNPHLSIGFLYVLFGSCLVVLAYDAICCNPPVP